MLVRFQPGAPETEETPPGDLFCLQIGYGLELGFGSDRGVLLGVGVGVGDLEGVGVGVGDFEGVGIGGT